MILRIATRGSALALQQAHRVCNLLERAHHGLKTETVIVHPAGDRAADSAIRDIGTVGIFTAEVDRAVQDGRAHMAVHSLKDLPTAGMESLRIAAVLARDDPRDVLIVAPGRPPSLDELRHDATIGTSSLRRRALLLARRADLRVEDLRGNIDTRLRRVANGDFDAIILALAGLERLGRTDVVSQILPLPDWLPAPGQGALAVSVAAEDADTFDLVHALDHETSRFETGAERALLAALQGGCRVPIGAHARRDGDSLLLHGFVASPDGQSLLHEQLQGDVTSPDDIGRSLAQRLIDRGAESLLRDARARAAAATREATGA